MMTASPFEDPDYKKWLDKYRDHKIVSVVGSKVHGDHNHGMAIIRKVIEKETTMSDEWIPTGNLEPPPSCLSSWVNKIDVVRKES